MRRVRTIAEVVFAAGLLLTFIFVLLVNSLCWSHRWQARRALYILQTMRPGQTSEAAFLDQTKAFRTGDNGVTVGVAKSQEEGSFAINNVPLWTIRMPKWEGRVWPPETVFWVAPSFKSGRLIHIKIMEEQGGSGHPFGARIEWGEMAPEDDLGEPPFDGYRLSQWEGDGVPPWGYIVRMDDRASQSERGRALDLSFQCFTRFERCRDARLFLQPVDNRPQ